ncbi:MAG TPA: nucleotidyltransferase family protein [Alphaproteobacteria bacterium]
MSSVALYRLLGRCLIAVPGAPPALVIQGGLPWTALIAAANDALVTPALHAPLRRCEAVPEDVRAYLGELHARNVRRNLRLRQQAAELIAALNRRGITPLLLKGAATLFEDGNPFVNGRMIADLDIVVERDRLGDAVAVLAALGYTRLPVAVAPHGAGDFVRPGQPGAIDLHVELLTVPQLLALETALTRSLIREADGIRFRVLDPTDRVLHLLLHDLVQDYGYYDGRLNLRHLYDVATLMRRDVAVDWSALRRHLAAFRLEAGIDFWLCAIEMLFGIAPPDRLPFRLRTRLLVRWALLQLRYRPLVRPGQILGNLRRSLAWYRLPERDKGLPRVRRIAAYLRTYRARTVSRVLHILFYRRS